MGAPAPDHLFVYGTLRAGFSAHHVLGGRVRLAGTGRIAGRLYDTGRYPAAVPSDAADEWVRGELYLLPPDDEGELLSSLDGYEGFLPHAPAHSLFVRVHMDVETADGERQPAWVYLFNRPTSALVRIPSGDYAARH